MAEHNEVGSKRLLEIQTRQDQQGRAILVLEVRVEGMQNLHEKLAELPVAIARIEERVRGGTPLANGGIARTKALVALAAALTAVAGAVGAAAGVLLGRAAGGG